MKNLFFSLLCLLCVQTASAQKDSLQVDEGNNYVYYQVADKPGLSADTLYKRAWNFASAFNSSNKPANGKDVHTLNTTGKFIVYSGASLVRKEAGQISYTINIQTKDQRYRYRISNFVFTPKQRDRFGNMIPVPGIEVPLEKLAAKYGIKDSDSYLDQTGSFCLITSNKLKQAIDKQPAFKKAAPVKKVSTENW